MLAYAPGHDLSAFSNETHMSIDEQMKYDHGLTFDDNSGRDQELVAADVKKWYKTHCNKDNNNFICIAVYTKTLYRFTIKKRK